MHENFDFVHLLSFFFYSFFVGQTLLEKYMYMYNVYANITRTKRLLCYRASSFFGLRRYTSYDWGATASDLSPNMPCMLVC